MELIELPSRSVLVQRGPSVGYVGPSLASVRLRRGAKAQGFILLHRSSHGAWQTFRMSARLITTAKRAAARIARKTGRKVILGELVEVDGPTQVIRSIASYETVSKMELLARATKAAGNVARILKAKDPDPYDPRDFDRMVDSLARDLNREAVPAFTQTVQGAITSSRIDWANATPKQVAGFSNRLAKKLGASAAQVYKSIGPVLAKTAVGMAESARSSFVKKHDLRVDRAISLKDKAAVTRSAATNVHYVRSFASGQMSESLSSQARTIIQSGINKGESSRVIGQTLHRKLSESAEGQTEAYFRMVASTVNTRSREFSSLRSMQDAGITAYEWSSVLDEATTETCRWLDGQVFSVQSALDRYAAADALEDPTDIKYEMPWFYEKKIQDGSHAGKMGIFMNQRGGMQRVAVVERGGFGKADAIGKYSNTKSSKQLEGMGMPACPGHGGCRSTTIPVEGSATGLSLPTPSRPAAASPRPTPRPVPKPKPDIGHFDPTKTKYSDGELARALRSDDAVSAREQLAAMMHEEGMIPYDHAWKEPEALKLSSQLELAGANGTHGWRGKISLKPRVYSEAVKFATDADLGLPGAKNYMSGFRTLVHESIHGCSPMQSYAYSGVGVFAEETSTEAAARYVLFKRYGKRLGFKATTFDITGSYKTYINETVKTMRLVRREVLDEVGIEQHFVMPGKFAESLGRASVKMRGGEYVEKARALALPEKWLEYFSDAVADDLTSMIAAEKNITGTQLKKLNKAMRTRMSKELLATAEKVMK